MGMPESIEQTSVETSEMVVKEQEVEVSPVPSVEEDKETTSSTVVEEPIKEVNVESSITSEMIDSTNKTDDEKSAQMTTTTALETTDNESHDQQTSADEMIALQEETESIEEGKFAPRDDPSRLSVNEKVVLHERSITQIAKSIRRRDENVQVNTSSGSEEETQQVVELQIRESLESAYDQTEQKAEETVDVAAEEPEVVEEVKDDIVSEVAPEPVEEPQVVEDIPEKGDVTSTTENETSVDDTTLSEETTV